MRLNSFSRTYRQNHLALLDINKSRIIYDNPRNDPLARAVEDITPDIKSEFVNGRNVWCFVVVGGKAPSDSKMIYTGLLLDRVDENEDRFKRFGYFRIIWENEKMVDYMEKRTIILI